MSLPEVTRWKMLSPLLDELLSLSRADQYLRLTELRARGEELAVDLESLLSAASRVEATQFLAGDMSTHEAVVSSLVGRQIGAYVIEALLGEGATGTVWRARRADGRFEGWAALKLLHLSLIGRAGALRFKREAVILARVAHSNIARLLDAGVTEDGQPYLVLELVEGTRIDEHCDAHRLRVRQRIALFNNVLAAVAHAHSHLVVHRDIKPNNIYVTADGQVKLLDFGIAKLLQVEPDNPPITAEGLRVLTPQYAAPEQLNGGPVTTATDIYALGVLLYHLLTGQHPTSSGSAASVEVIRATLNAPPVRLSAALDKGHSSESQLKAAADRGTSLLRLRRELQGDLENIVSRTLRKNPSDRYQTVASLADDLRRYLANEPVEAKPDSLTRRYLKLARRNRKAVTMGLLVLLSAASGLTGAIVQEWRSQPSHASPTLGR
jgi:serine/threonine-protein kinase